MKNLVIIAVTIGLLSCVSSQKTENSNRYPAQYSSGTLKTGNMNFNSLIKSLKDSNAKNVEEALAAVSKNYPEYLEFHTLMYDSFSLHQSSFLEPRVIVYGPKAEFILTFNGGTHMRGGNALEVMQYEASTGAFQFREISFKTPLKNETATFLTEADIEFENSNMKYTKANPNKCATCHGQSARPIWETYFLWPGAYGGNDDTLTSLFNKQEVKYNGNYSSMLREGSKPGDSLGRLIQLKPGVQDNELIGIRKFIAGKSQHPRYKYLPNRAVDIAFVRMNAGENADAIDTSDATSKRYIDLGVSTNGAAIYSRPNFSLNELFYSLVTKSFFIKASANPNTKNLPFKIAWIQKCTDQLNTQINQPKDDSNFRNENRDIFRDLKDILSSAEEDQIKKRSGPWKEFYQKFMLEELDMEAEKIQRFERTFGDNSVQLTKSYRQHFFAGRSPKYYKSINGKNLTRLEEIASHDESDDFYKEAASAYVAKGMGMDLQAFATDLRRVPTFRESGWNYLIKEFVQRKLISPSTESYSPLPDMKVACPEILAQARGN